MKKKLLGLMLGATLAVTACSGKGDNMSKSSMSASGSMKMEGSAKSSMAGSKADTATSSEKETGSEKFPAFKSVDINGNEVTEAVFADKDITMVNIWGTFCGPCIEEMPELQKIYSKLPENANMIGIVADAPVGEEKSINAAKEIIAKAGAKFTNVVLDESMIDFVQKFFSLPTTIFVDKEGNIVGDPVIGASPEKYIERLQGALEGWKYE